MNVYELAALIFVFGSLGGFANCLLVGSDRFLPGYDGQRNWLPGWLGSLLLGGIAAVVIWGMYGSSASYDLLGSEKFLPHLTLAQLLTSLVIGMGGSRILTLEAQKLILRSQRDIEEQTKDRLVKAANTLLDAHPERITDMALDKQRIREMLDQVANTKGRASLQKADDLVTYLSTGQVSDQEGCTAEAVVVPAPATREQETARGK